MTEKVDRKRTYETPAVSSCFVFKEGDVLLSSDGGFRHEEIAEDIFMS